jgi:hypothetical protein
VADDDISGTRLTATQRAASAAGQCLVTVCRGCCCGDPGVNPDVDHDTLLRELTQRLRGTASVRVSDCLLLCEESNVVVVAPPASNRRTGARTTWFSSVLDAAVNALIIEWVRAGGPGQPLAPGLQCHVTAPPMIVRDASGRERVVRGSLDPTPTDKEDH